MEYLQRHITTKSNFKILTSFHLKNIALITMIIDHMGSVFFTDLVGLKIIGRIAFVLYAFLLVNGCSHTSNISKYAKRLFVWALISEVPFDLVFNHSFFSLKSQNIFFTLLIGALGIHFYKQYKNKLLKITVLVSGVLIGYLFKVDYSWYGVGLIYGLYLLRDRELLKFGFLQGFSVTYAVCCLHLAQIFAFLGVIPIYFYNGKLGRKSGRIYYAYYALHLILFYIIKVLYDYYTC